MLIKVKSCRCWCDLDKLKHRRVHFEYSCALGKSYHSEGKMEGSITKPEEIGRFFFVTSDSFYNISISSGIASYFDEILMIFEAPLFSPLLAISLLFSGPF